MSSISQWMTSAAQYHQMGHLAQAEGLYRQVLQSKPDHPDALHYLGLLAQQTGRQPLALELLTKAAGLMPGNAQCQLHLSSALQSAGRRPEALAAAQRAVELKRDFAEAHNQLGGVNRDLGKFPEALAAFERALQLKPNFAEAHNGIGTLMAMQGKYAEAIESYRHAIKQRPNYAHAFANLANVYRESGQANEALQCYHQALQLQPNYPEAMNNLGIAYAQAGQLPQAVSTFQQAIRLRPNYAYAYGNLGLAFTRLARYDEAIQILQQAIQLAPHYAEAYHSLGNVYRELNKHDEAAMQFQKAVELSPKHPEMRLSLGMSLARRHQSEEALGHVETALKLRPHHAETHNVLGGVYRDLGRFTEAMAEYDRALELKPDYAEAHNNAGIGLVQRGQLDEAMRRFDQSLALKPDYADAHLSRALVWLLQAQWDKAWPEYEWRWQCKHFPPRQFAQPRWDGSPLQGKTILLYTEQGMGDAIQFVRYAKVLKERGATVILECPTALMRLFASCPGIDQLVAKGSPLPAFDVHAPLLSLPLVMGTDAVTKPDAIPYLHANPELVRKWQEELAKIDGFKIGIAWKGSPVYGGDRQRSIALEQFAPLAKVPGVRLFSLQKGLGSEQVQQLGGRFPLIDWTERIDEQTGPFMDTAALIMNLDLVICVDTAVGHLAGALGRPYWLAVPLVPDWRWTMWGDGSPWYPSLRLFRQKELGNWSEVFERMTGEIAVLASGGRKSPVGTRPTEKMDSTGGLRPPLADTIIQVEIAVGELIDKITILEIKSARIADANKVRNVRTELATLTAVREKSVPMSAKLDALTAALRSANEALWDIEDEIRRCELSQDFGARFVELARSVYRTNDRRAALKREINELLGSRLVEEKSYSEYGS